MVNHVMLVGRIGRAPEVRRTQGGSAMLRFSVATEHSYKGPNGEWSRQTDWHNVVVFGKFADAIAPRLHKGSLVLVAGRGKSGSYEKNGQKVYTYDIVAETVNVLDGKPSEPPQAAHVPASAAGFDGDTDDCPF